MSLSVISVGCRTALGLDARASALAFRAGVVPLRGAPFAGRDGQPIVAGFLPTLPWELGAAGRAAALGEAAAREALAGLPARRPAPKLAVLAVTSSGGEAALRARLEALPGLEAIELVTEGEACAADALPRVRELLSGGADVVLWGGAHSDADPERLRALVERDRLLDGEHLDAIVPGEAAAFVALARQGSHPAPLAELEGFGVATTPARPDDDTPADGGAWTEAVTRAAAAGPAGWVLFDVGYEALRLREWEAVQVRARAALAVPYRWDDLYQRLGRLGAATLPVGGALVAASAGVGHRPAERALGMYGTDAGRRAAVAWRVR